MTLRSPTTGLPLRPEGAHVLTDGRERWPVLDGIPYLRTGRAALVAAALADLDRGDADAALVRLLSDQDEWWDGPVPAEDERARLVRERDGLSLRDAMAILRYGRVGDYFAHRWSDPTYLAGIALIDAHWSEPRTAFELACGIGHYLRDLAAAGLATTGGDVVFSKLWLARHWVVGPGAALVCFDAGSPWPVADERYDLVLCQDAFYFLEPKADILGRLRAAAAGTLAIGHVHNAEAENLSAGRGMSADDVARLFPRATLYDDAELTRAAAEGRVPRPAEPAALRTVDAFALAEGRARSGAGPLATLARPMRRNPLYRATPEGDAAIAWPSARYGAEYGPLATYPGRTSLPERPVAWTAEQARRREIVPLPERW